MVIRRTDGDQDYFVLVMKDLVNGLGFTVALKRVPACDEELNWMVRLRSWNKSWHRRIYFPTYKVYMHFFSSMMTHHLLTCSGKFLNICIPLLNDVLQA